MPAPFRQADLKCRSWAARQDGLLTLRQALAAGHSRRSLRRRVENGIFNDELPGVLAIAGAGRSRNGAIRAATMWGGEGTAASHASAARLHGLDIAAEGQIDISITRWKECQRLHLPDGTPIVVHRVDEKLLPEIREIDEIPVTSARRTILDMAGKKHPRSERMLDFCLTRDLTYLGDLWLFLEQEWMRGRRGVRILRDLLIPRTHGYGPSDSDLEIMFRRLVEEHRLPTPVAQHPISLPEYTIHPDFAYPEAQIAIELDSYSHHLNRKAFEDDRARDVELTMLGWTVLRFTWAMMRYEPDRVATVIRSALRFECT